MARRMKTNVLTAMLLLMLSGCGLVAERHGTALPAPDTFSISGEAALQERWWKAFGDPDLDALIEHALHRNFSLRSVWSRLDQAAAVARKAGSDRYPSLDASAGAERLSERDGTTTESSRYSAALSAAYEVDLWGRVRSTAEAAELDRRATQAQLQTAALTLSAEVATTWYQYAEQQAQVDLLARQLDTNEQVRELVTLRFRHGQVGAIDVLQQRQLAESSRGDLALARSRAAVLRHRLAVLLGEDPATEVIPEPSAGALVSLPTLPATGVPALQLQQRPDVRQGWLALQAADRRVAAAVAERLPRLSLGASASDTSRDHRDLFDDWLGNIAANLLLPVIDGGNRRAEVDRTRAVAEEAWNDYRQALLEAWAEVEDALVQERRQAEYLDSLAVQTRLSKQAIERLYDRYRNGAVDYIRVLDAALTDQSLERSQLQARRQWIEYRIALHRALAGGWDVARPADEAVSGS